MSDSGADGKKPKVRLAVTGHRPKDLGGYSDAAFVKLVAFAKNNLGKWQPRIEYVITGMAQGWDQAVAQACVELGLPFHAYVPHI
jgi:hypothetical protein